MVEYMSLIIQVLLGMFAAAIFAIIFWWSNRPSGTTTIDWLNLAGYVIVGAGLGAINGYLGIDITLTSVSASMTEYMVIILLIDQVLAGIFKTPAATFVLKYTGHTFYPKFTLELNDGTVQTFNTETTGRCCAIGVAMKPAQWSPGFKVLPAFADGVSPYAVALKITTGRNPDLSLIKQITVDWNDGSVAEKIPLAKDINGNTSGIAAHTYEFNGTYVDE
jgi:hypothetical protein